MTAKAPRVAEEEIQPLTVEEAQRLLLAASRRRNGTRWAVALALGLRQGEALGLQWPDVDLTTATVRVRQALQRRTWQHGCTDPHQCGQRYHKTMPCKFSMTSNPAPVAGPSRCHLGSSPYWVSITPPNSTSATSPAISAKTTDSSSPAPPDNP